MIILNNMKSKIITLLFIAQSLFLFGQTVNIKGVLTNIDKGDTLIFKGFASNENSDKKIIVNSKTGEFSYTGQIQTAGYYRLAVADQNFLMLLLTPGDKITINADARDLYGTAKIQGSPQTTLFYEANAIFVDFKKQKDSLQQAFTNLQELQSLKEENFAINFIKKNNKSLTSLMMIDKINKETHSSVLVELDSSLYLEYPMNKMVQDFHGEISRLRFLREGSIAPDIDLKDKDGKSVKLSSLRGKVALIDFWATWCGPCKAEIPNLQKIYDAYRDKGFEIYSISLDRDKDKWLKGSDDLKWTSVLDEGGVVSNLYGITSIPSMFLIDRDGKIVAKNLRGAQLYLKVSDMFQ